jgi:hypothetical protein
VWKMNLELTLALEKEEILSQILSLKTIQE